jgi:hypothetical protein
MKSFFFLSGLLMFASIKLDATEQTPSYVITLPDEIRKTNLSVNSFPKADPEFFEDRPDIPEWWQSTLTERDSFFSTQVKKGEVINYGTSAGGHPLLAVGYGTPRTGRGTTTANGALGFGNIRAWLGPDHTKRVGVIFSGIHAGEFEGIVATMNLLAVLETGKDLGGRAQPSLALAAARFDRIIIIPIANPDARARIPTRMLPFTGNSKTASYINVGAWTNGSLVGWPANKEFAPIDFKLMQFAGGYFNDAGINFQHDNFLGTMQPETRALLDLCARERPDLSLNLHTGANWNDYFLVLCHSDINSALEPAWADLYRRVHSSLAIAGHRSTTDPVAESDLTLTSSFGQNLDTAINFHAGTLSAMIESPSVSFAEKRRDGTPVFSDPLKLIDAHLCIFTAAFDYVVDTGGLPAWTIKKTAQ